MYMMVYMPYYTILSVPQYALLYKVMNLLPHRWVYNIIYLKFANVCRY